MLLLYESDSFCSILCCVLICRIFVKELRRNVHFVEKDTVVHIATVHGGGL